jgi:hypothetical protein
VLAQRGHWSLDLTHANRQGRFERTTLDHLYGFFLASGEFQTPKVIGEITFGDKELFINTVISPNGRPLRHGLWEWADATGHPELVPRNTDFVTQAERLQRIVREMARAVLELADVVALADAHTVQRMAAARAVAQSAFDARCREAEHRGTVRIASEAFRQKNWPRVIELLASIEDRLTRSESAKLRYARAQVE